MQRLQVLLGFGLLPECSIAVDADKVEMSGENVLRTQGCGLKALRTLPALERVAISNVRLQRRRRGKDALRRAGAAFQKMNFRFVVREALIPREVGLTGATTVRVLCAAVLIQCVQRYKLLPFARGTGVGVLGIVVGSQSGRVGEDSITRSALEVVLQVDMLVQASLLMKIRPQNSQCWARACPWLLLQ